MTELRYHKKVPTRAQKEALFKVFQRDFPSWVSPGWRKSHLTNEKVRVPLIQYLKFRRKATWAFGSDMCIMLPWRGMWLGVEPDGYVHS